MMVSGPSRPSEKIRDYTGGVLLDGTLCVGVTDGVDVLVWLGVAGLTGACTVVLLTEQSGGLSCSVFRPLRGRGELGDG